MRVALVDYDSGNLHSAEKAVARMGRDIGAEVIVTSDPDVVAKADKVLLPGDGAFPACRKALGDVPGLIDALTEAALVRKVPFFGICVGMQLLATASEEYQETPGLGWIGGRVVPIQPEDPSLKVPHMGWNDLVIDVPHPVFDGIATGDHAYFVHSYHFKTDDPAHQLAHTNYGGAITAVVGRDNILGAQFHPEKSQDVGLRMISNWLRMQT